MAEVVVDTDVASFIHKNSPFAEIYLPHLDGNLLVMSFQTAAEMERWALVRGWGTKRQSELQAYFQQYIVYPYNRALLSTWAFVMYSARRSGRPILCADAWVASVAVLQDIPLVTHNRNDYLGVPGLRLISEA